MFTFVRGGIRFFSSSKFGATHANPRPFTTSNGFHSPAKYSGDVTKDTLQSADKASDEHDGSPEGSIVEGNPASNQFTGKVEEVAKEGDERKEEEPEDYVFPPNSQDFMLENVNYEYLKKRAHNIWFSGSKPICDTPIMELDTPKYGYLETAEVLPKNLPVRGYVCALNRMWINLVCQAQRAPTKDGKSQYGPARNVTFLVALNSPYTYMTKQAMESLAPDLKPTPEKLDVQFHPVQIGADEVYMSPESSHFSGANVLGSNILKRSKMKVFINFRKSYFEIFETAGNESESGLK